MKSYLALVSKYLTTNKKKTRLVIASVAISVALVTGIFSMLDIFMKSEKIKVIDEYGNYHMMLINPTDKEMKAISSRIDVQNTGRWIDLGKGTTKNGIVYEFGAIDEDFADDINVQVVEGRFPQEPNEIILEQWAAEDIYLNAKVNDTVKLSLPGGAEQEWVVSGLANDLSHGKAKGSPVVMMSIDRALAEKNDSSYYAFVVQFKDRVNINKAKQDIVSDLNIADDRISLNARLLAVIGQGISSQAQGTYATGAILFGIVLVAGVIMIYNTFNISVMERVKRFGLLRCIGASQAQVKKLVRREGLAITLRAIPIGVLAGILITFVSSAMVKFSNEKLFGHLPLFSFSWIGIGAGIVVGFLTVYIASFIPARKAAKVSPVNAVTGSNELKLGKRKKLGLLTKLFRAEYAMGINNALLKKKTLMLMAASIAVSIILFLGFQVFIDVMHTGLKTTKPYTPDISLISEEQGMDQELYSELADVNGVDKVYGRMFGYADVAFDTARLDDSYKEKHQIEVKDNGLFVPPESSWLISYDEHQLKWAKEDLIDGELSEDALNTNDGVIAVAMHYVKGKQTKTAQLQVGDKIHVSTAEGPRTLTVMGMLRDVPFSNPKPSLTTFITTEQLFTELVGPTHYKSIDIQLAGGNQEQAVNEMKGMINPDHITFLDQRQQNAELDQTFFTMAVFVYGFVAIIALISILNIINTMSTSVVSKTKYLGVMRAVGMESRQLNRMVLIEAGTYSLTGCLIGITLGLVLQYLLITQLLSTYYIIWEFPFEQIILIVVLILLVTLLSVISPLKRVKKQGISEVINSL